MGSGQRAAGAHRARTAANARRGRQSRHQGGLNAAAFRERGGRRESTQGASNRAGKLRQDWRQCRLRLFIAPTKRLLPMQFADRLNNVETSAIRELFKLLGKPGIISFAGGFPRSEERRVGKECRSRWSPYH